MVVRFGTQELTNPRREQTPPENDKAKPVAIAPRVLKLTSKYFGDAMLVAVADYIERQMPSSPVLPLSM